MPHLDAISFFIVALPVCAAVFVRLWNGCFAQRLRYADGLRFVAVWMLFTIVVLVMNQIGRETLDPGRWPRERLFHGVRAIRLIPVDDGKMFGRDGILAHSYMLGPSGDSNGCVSFRDYPAFLNAFLTGKVDRLVVVEHLATTTTAKAAFASGG